MSKIVHASHAVVFAGACLLRGCYLKRIVEGPTSIDVPISPGCPAKSQFLLPKASDNQAKCTYLYFPRSHSNIVGQICIYNIFRVFNISRTV